MLGAAGTERWILQEAEPELVGEQRPEGELEAPPRALIGEAQEGRLGLVEEEGAAVDPDADDLLDPGSGQARVAEQAAGPADQILGEQDQFLIDGAARLVTGGQARPPAPPESGSYDSYHGQRLFPSLARAGRTPPSGR